MDIVQYADNGVFMPRCIASALQTTSEELSRTVGLGKRAIQRKDRIRSNRTQLPFARASKSTLRLGANGLCLVSFGATVRLFPPLIWSLPCAIKGNSTGR